MGIDEFWELVATARRALPDGAGSDDMANQMAEILSGPPAADIVAHDQALWDLMDVSYSERLWGAAYLVRGGASDDGFDYFRGWLIAQGREVFERAVADPDSLADHPTIIEGAEMGEADAENEGIISVTFHAYRTATGADLPPDASTRSIPDLEGGWDFENEQQTREHLPRLAALYYDHE